MSAKIMDLQRKHLMDAFQYDCQTLLTRFELTYNTHFQNFCEIWREMQFSLMFDCQASETILNIFYKNALHVTKQFLVNASGLKERIGALYLMYSVYYMVKTDDTKIRMTLSDWKCLINLHQQVKVEEYLDANYILCKLIVDHAFIHCLGDNEYGIEKHFQKDKYKPILDYNILPEIKDLAAPGKLLSTINNLSKLYEEKKRIFVKQEDISSVQFYDANIANDIINSIRTMQSESRTLSKSAFYENTNSNKPTPSTSASMSEFASTFVSAPVPVAVPIPMPVTVTVSSSSSSSPSPSPLPSPSSISASNSQNKKTRKCQVRRRKKLILAKIGNAFETALKSESESESEGEMRMEIDSDPLQGM